MGLGRMASMGSQARAAVFGVLATVLLIATVCVLDEPTSVTSREANQEENPASYGNGYLEGLAKKLNEKKDARRKGQEDMDSFGYMLHSFTSAHENKELGQALKRSLRATEHEAQKKSDVDIPMPSIDKNGYPRVHTQFSSLPKPKEESDSELTPDMFNDEDMLLQESSSEAFGDEGKGAGNEDLSEVSWTPKGQPGLQDRLTNLAQEQDKKQEKYIEDSIPGFHPTSRDLPSEGPVTEDFAAPLSKDPFEMEFVQEWHPQGQEMKVPKGDYQSGYGEDDDKIESVIDEDRDASAENDIMASVKTALVNNDVERGVESLSMQDFGLELIQAEANTDTAAGAGSGTSPVQITIARKNAATLKAYATLVADKVLDMTLPKKAPLADLLLQMAQKSKLSPAKQYAAVTAAMKANFTTGLPQYVADNIAAAMAKPAGLLVMGPISCHSGNFVHIDGKYLGLSDPFELVMKLSVSTSKFIAELSKIDAAVAGVRMKRADKLKAQLTVKDFNALFVPVCVGKTAPSAACHKLNEAACGASNSCKWRPAWDGSEVFSIMDAHIHV